MNQKEHLDKCLSYYVLGVTASSVIFYVVGANDLPPAVIFLGVLGAIIGGFLSRWLNG